ncbi:MAG: hypothetical protein K9H64_00565 [Bacteroidales bacterium]|nr:hypothetical protein [Bacteroidales bacterium]
MKNYLNSLFVQISNKIIQGKFEFDGKKLNYNKCVKCSYRNYCGHKTSEFNEIKIPYSNYYLGLKRIPFQLA